RPAPDRGLVHRPVLAGDPVPPAPAGAADGDDLTADAGGAHPQVGDRRAAPGAPATAAAASSEAGLAPASASRCLAAFHRSSMAVRAFSWERSVSRYTDT